MIAEELLPRILCLFILLNKLKFNYEIDCQYYIVQIKRMKCVKKLRSGIFSNEKQMKNVADTTLTRPDHFTHSHCIIASVPICQAGSISSLPAYTRSISTHTPHAHYHSFFSAETKQKKEKGQ